MHKILIITDSADKNWKKPISDMFHDNPQNQYDDMIKKQSHYGKMYIYLCKFSIFEIYNTLMRNIFEEKQFKDCICKEQANLRQLGYTVASLNS